MFACILIFGTWNVQVEIFVSQHGIGGSVTRHSFICKMINIKWSAVYFLPEMTSVIEQMVKPQGHPN